MYWLTATPIPCTVNYFAMLLILGSIRRTERQRTTQTKPLASHLLIHVATMLTVLAIAVSDLILIDDG